MRSEENPTQIAQGIYWVGAHLDSSGLQCNPYLLVDQGAGVLFDPGSVLDFHFVLENIEKIIPLEKIKHVVLHHQDPDFCSSVPLFEKAGARFTIVTHWRAQTIIKFYGISSQFYLIDENNYSLKLDSGREISFVPTPYLHFPGAFCSYDGLTQTLFSSDLFGALSSEWELYAGENYIEKMKSFHEHYMPSNDILRPVMESLLMMEIQLIAPQHGSVISKEIPLYIKALRDLECGAFLRPVKKNLKKAGGYSAICSIVTRRLSALFPSTEVLEALGGMEVELDPLTHDIRDYNYTGSELWERLFEAIFLKRGIKWLLLIEPLVLTLSAEYDLPIPKIFASQLKKALQQTLLLKEEVSDLKTINERLTRNIEETQGKITTCPVTGLYNEAFFKQYLNTELEAAFLTEEYENKCLVVFGLDNLSRIRFLYGDLEADNAMKGLAYLLTELKAEQHLLFRLQGPAIACFMPNTSKAQAALFAEECRNEVRLSGKFLDTVTVSAGVASLKELVENAVLPEEFASKIYEVAMTRLELAKNRGGNLICSESSVDEAKPRKGTILICDSDCANRDVLTNFLENLGYNLLAASDGEGAFELIEKESPDLIISEIMLPKIDGFILCEKLKLQSATKDIPFFITSSLKNEDSVNRALSLGIEHYFQKPYLLCELIGIVKMKLNGADLNEN